LFGTNLQTKIERGVALYAKNTIQANHVEFKSEFEESVGLA